MYAVEPWAIVPWHLVDDPAIYMTGLQRLGWVFGEFARACRIDQDPFQRLRMQFEETGMLAKPAMHYWSLLGLLDVRQVLGARGA